ncbi:NUDIX hydrolase [Lysobacter enzymogenes]|uniref:NUDIX hydrolase n=1 Tax=Lysobacter enzymogenes TaxID=69 RepID=A0A3N2RDP2_LYSEN|nr:NUDIX hydrolase [Lysobacter enzymogenes]ROU05557.1 NUDIX hydrolase [Lysobacter enzymogenes]
MPAQTPDAIAELRSTLSDYARRWPEEAGHTAPFLELLAETDEARGALQHDAAVWPDPFRRERLAGHFTGSAWLVDRAGARVLLTHHRKLGRWLQLGGHADGDRDLAAVALKEAEEESGLAGLSVEPELFDLDRHWIPERGDVPGHWHYDLRYVVRAGDSEAFVVGEESLALAWREIEAVLADPDSDDSMRRLARKWLARGG